MEDHTKKLKRIKNLFGTIDNESKAKIASAESIENPIHDVFLRLPELAEQIFEILNNRSITNCRMVNLLWLGTIDNIKGPSIRIINKHVELSEEYKRTKGDRQNPFIFFRALMLKKKKKVIEEILRKSHEKNPNIMGKLTPLHFAASKGNFFTAVLMKTIGVERNPRDLLQWTPFIHAAEGGHLSACKMLISLNADVECRTNLEETALHHASYQGHYEICELIIKKTRYINPQNYDNVTPFLRAVINGDLELSKLFVGSNVDTAITTGTCKRTPLHFAALHGHLEICKLLLDRVEDKNPLDFEMCTPLHYAALRGHLDVVKLLIEKNVDVDIKTNDGSTALHFAAKNGHYKVCQLIIEVAKEINPNNDMGCTPLDLSKKEEIIELILLHAYFEQYKWTQLHIAASVGNLEDCQEIVKHLEDKNPVESNGITPIHLAALNGHVWIYKWLSRCISSDKNPMDSFGQTPLHFAADNGDFLMCQMILNVSDNKKFDANLADDFGNTPLSVAFKKARLSAKHRAVYELFLSLGFFGYKKNTKKNLRSRADLSKIDGLLHGRLQIQN